jgi:hypothetical protein
LTHSLTLKWRSVAADPTWAPATTPGTGCRLAQMCVVLPRFACHMALIVADSSDPTLDICRGSHWPTVSLAVWMQESCRSSMFCASWGPAAQVPTSRMVAGPSLVPGHAHVRPSILLLPNQTPSSVRASSWRCRVCISTCFGCICHCEQDLHATAGGAPLTGHLPA